MAGFRAYLIKIAEAGQDSRVPQIWVQGWRYLQEGDRSYCLFICGRGPAQQAVADLGTQCLRRTLAHQAARVVECARAPSAVQDGAIQEQLTIKHATACGSCNCMHAEARPLAST